MYLFFVVLIVVIGLYIFLPEDKYKKVGIVISLLAIFSLFAFRDNVGIDDQRYRFFYEIVQYNDTNNEWELSGVEWSYRALSSLFSSMGLNYKSIFLFYAFVSFLFLYLIINELKLDKDKSFLFLLTFMAFCIVPYITTMRSFLAAVIIIYTMLKFAPKQIYFWLPLFLLAVFIHKSSLFFLPVFLLKDFKLFENKYFLIFTPIVLFVINLFGIWQPLKTLMLNVGIDYANYIGSDKGGLGGTGIMVTALFILYVISVIMGNRKKIEATYYKNIVKFSFLFFSLHYLTFGVGFLGRISYAFLPFEASSIIILYEIARSSGRRIVSNRRILILVITVILGSISIYNIGRSEIGSFSIENYSLNFLAERRNE